MRNHCVAAVLILLAATSASAQSASALNPPVAEKKHTEKPIHGAVLIDDYGWLRNKSDPKVKDYLEAENAYAEQFTAGEKPFSASR